MANSKDSHSPTKKIPRSKNGHVGMLINGPSRRGGNKGSRLSETGQDSRINRRLKEQQTLARITTALSQSQHTGPAELLKLIVDSSRELITNAEQAVIHLIDRDQALLAPGAVSGVEFPEMGGGRLKIGEGAAGQVVAEGVSVYIPDVREDARFVNLSSGVAYLSLLVSPVRSGSGMLGTISVQSKKHSAFTKNDIELLDELGQQAAIAIENARLLETTRQALKETSALYRINQGLVSLDVNDLLNDAVDLLKNNFDYYHVQVFVADAGSEYLMLKAASGAVGKRLVGQKHRIRAGTGIIGYAAETGAPFFTNDVDEVVFFVYDPNLPETKAEMAVPVRNGETLYGILDIQQTADKPFTQRDEQLVVTVADQLALALHKAELYKNLQTSLKQEKAMRSQLVQNERLAIMGRLLASVSHELNNPLQAIQNALFLLKEEKGISPQGQNDLQIVLSESERMAGMIERLRDTYRPTQAEDLQPTHLNDIIEDVLALIATHLKKNKIAYNFAADPDMPVIMAQPDQIRQVMLNLLMNGVEAMTEEGILTITTEYLGGSSEALICISDTGMGIPPAILPLIFDPFVTNKTRGTGIGLTISHDIVVKHRGRISAENNPDGHGATFKVWLPVRSIPAEGK